MRVLVHGGAGSRPDDPEGRRSVLVDAADAGSREEVPLDAVETAINRLEADPRFNAGVGSAVQSDGVIRTDAGIMTDDRRVGAACSMAGVERAVSVARAVLEETPHVLVAGDRAVALAEAVGVETDVDCWTERTRERWDAIDAPDPAATADQLEWVRERFGRTDPDGRDSDGVTDRDHDTVGAVAFDGRRFAAATSTGGRWGALAGRVGDVPQVGSGFYCSPACAVSTTGAGEDIARTTLARRTASHVERGLDAGAAADLAIEEFAELTGSSAGVIVVDADGRYGSAFNSDAMQTAAASRTGARNRDVRDDRSTPPR
ncbi:isoaspartyl peptidase/L-asparaginase [Natrialbaceae archaeon GCM10025810]|uniref:isoaspartyl peptidase/L-asparaginase n=1 Tax=Halovalidus salilacus TaxID=3075124 RepID=UPI003611E96A